AEPIIPVMITWQSEQLALTFYQLVIAFWRILIGLYRRKRSGIGQYKALLVFFMRCLRVALVPAQQQNFARGQHFRANLQLFFAQPPPHTEGRPEASAALGDIAPPIRAGWASPASYIAVVISLR